MAFSLRAHMSEYKKTVAIMQPYLFPNLNYFQLVAAADGFVFYDDVNFMKKGWSHRNTILLNGAIHLFTCPLRKASQNKLIYELEIADYEAFKNNFLLKIHHAYRKYKYWSQLDAFLGAVFQRPFSSLSDLAISSVVTFAHMANIDCVFKTSSTSFASTRPLSMSERLARITQCMGGKIYLNKESGRSLYNPSQFSLHGIDLAFLASYNETCPRLSLDNFFPHISVLHQIASFEISLISDFVHDYRVFNA